MSIVQTTRRDFLADVSRAVIAGGFALQLPLLASLAGCARDGDELVLLTPAESRAMRAFAAQIIPSEPSAPGAEEAGAIHFVERALALPLFIEHAPVIRAGLADLDARARTTERRADFASLSASRQIEIMTAVQREPFFDMARTIVVIGTLADPSYGGNRNGAGWAMLGFEHQPSYSSPYGWYDAQQPSHGAPRAD